MDGLGKFWYDEFFWDSFVERCEKCDGRDNRLRAPSINLSIVSLRTGDWITGRQAAISARPVSIILQYIVVPTVTGSRQCWSISASRHILTNCIQCVIKPSGRDDHINYKSN